MSESEVGSVEFLVGSKYSKSWNNTGHFEFSYLFWFLYSFCLKEEEKRMEGK